MSVPSVHPSFGRLPSKTRAVRCFGRLSVVVWCLSTAACGETGPSAPMRGDGSMGDMRSDAAADGGPFTPSDADTETTDAGTADDGGMLPEPDTTYTIDGTTYYLNADDGDDAADGLTRETAWRTVDKALATLEDGDGVLMASGNYGSLSESSPGGRNDYVTFVADEGERPVLTSISVSYDTLADAYLRFDGLDIEPEWVDPGADPQLPDASSSTYNKSAVPFSVTNAAHVQLFRANLTGTNKYLTDNALRIVDARHVHVSSVHARRINRAVHVQSSRAITVAQSLFHEGTGSCIRVLPGNQDVVIDGVHCYDFGYDESDDYSPRGRHTPHGSAVSIRSGDLTIRHSIFHDGFNSAGIMTYDTEGSRAADYDNILLENNLLYDITNAYPLRIYGLGENVVIRNNLLVGKYRIRDGEITNDGRYRFGTAFVLHSVADGHSPSELQLYNNIMVGIVAASPSIDEHHNIIWSRRAGDGWECDPAPSSIIATCSYGDHPDLFESDFFAEPVSFAPGHDETLDFRPARPSPAFNGGDATLQPATSLGTLDELGFIQRNGTPRDADHHSVGPYEP